MYPTKRIANTDTAQHILMYIRKLIYHIGYPNIKVIRN